MIELTHTQKIAAIYVSFAATIISFEILLSAKKFFDRYAVLLERAKSKGLISFCEVSP